MNPGKPDHPILACVLRDLGTFDLRGTGGFSDVDSGFDNTRSFFS
jgi:hypothetical protein